VILAAKLAGRWYIYGAPDLRGAEKETLAMTTLLLELPPELYERLRAEAQRRGKPTQAVAEALLVEQLRAAEPISDSPPAYPELAPEVRAMLTSMTTDDLVVPPQGTPDDAIALLRSWNEVDEIAAAEQADTLEYLMQALDEDRLSNRPLFPEPPTKQ
jgi:hypothetical protein